MTTAKTLEAAHVAALAHAGQKYGDFPYVCHPLDVARKVLDIGGSEDQVLAALLHDTVEDTALTLEVIGLRFGSHAASLVGELTHNQDVPYEEYLEGLSDEARDIKVQDVVSNLLSLPFTGLKPSRQQRLEEKYRRALEILRSPLQPATLQPPTKETP